MRRISYQHAPILHVSFGDERTHGPDLLRLDTVREALKDAIEEGSYTIVRQGYVKGDLYGVFARSVTHDHGDSIRSQACVKHRGRFLERVGSHMNVVELLHRVLSVHRNAYLVSDPRVCTIGRDTSPRVVGLILIRVYYHFVSHSFQGHTAFAKANVVALDRIVEESAQSMLWNMTDGAWG